MLTSQMEVSVSAKTAIAGIGVDTVDIDRFASSLKRTPGLRDRLLAESERELPVHSLAARFAAKEALIKALGGSEGFTWHDAVIVNNELGAPSFAHTESLDQLLVKRGLAHPHLSLTHDAGVATAFVIVEWATS
jgi:holo-[acyl-carrier protein] synthase